MKTGDAVPSGNPIFAWRTRIGNDPVRGGGTLALQQSIYCLATTWNEWIAGVSRDRLLIPHEFNWRKIPEFKAPKQPQRDLVLAQHSQIDTPR